MDNRARTMQNMPEDMIIRQVGNLVRCDPASGAGTAQRMGIPRPVEDAAE
ncbi:MAG: hypothetical protein HKN05_09540 [Rhizobiales bacterium]|nr:hypothetical protein [Hyphomicrobiales bacterium]